MTIISDDCDNCGMRRRSGEYSRMIAVVDRDLDCVVAYKCPDCGAEKSVPLAEVLAVADPAAFGEPHKN